MRYMHAVAPVVFAFLCGYNLRVAAVNTDEGLDGFADFMPWILMAVSGIIAIYGAWRACLAVSSRA